MKMNDVLTLNVLMYLLIFGAAIIVAVIESRDWRCTNSYDLLSGCDKGEGMPYRGSKPSDSDNYNELLSKISLAAKSEKRSIKWRRAFVLATTIATLIFVLVVTPASLPEWTKFYLAVIIGAAVMYYNFNYYSYHLYREPQINIDDAVLLLKNKISQT